MTEVWLELGCTITDDAGIGRAGGVTASGWGDAGIGCIGCTITDDAGMGCTGGVVTVTGWGETPNCGDAGMGCTEGTVTGWGETPNCGGADMGCTGGTFTVPDGGDAGADFKVADGAGIGCTGGTMTVPGAGEENGGTTTDGG